MRLLRVQVPEFRALKNVDISFEPEFNPQVFPLGSLNGGGKSTLLQLIFVLPHYFWHENRNRYIKNIVSEIKNKNLGINSLAKITIQINSSKVCFEYFYGEKEIMREYAKSLDDKISYYSSENCESFYFLGTMTFTDIENAAKKTEIIKKLKDGIYLISPSNQPYLFLSREERRLLFNSNQERTHEQVLKSLKKDLPGFFTYDFNDVLIEIFSLETANDARERAETGIYGTHVEELEKSINRLLMESKQIIPFIIKQRRYIENAIQSVMFKLPSGQEIYPEDLSNGELKRLAIFVLLKYHDIQDAIVMFDEIENGFHPDWQYEIVQNLVDWGKDNQYILATHSYELCTALTRSHVKDLEPPLIKA